ncbi:MAG: hypothetical protein EOO65_02495 [Methanosarcinales archaeon]|nr:MAG: hypothetical protein EOO65_02495 [Methanosarcinales archaeon]
MRPAACSSFHEEGDKWTVRTLWQAAAIRIALPAIPPTCAHSPRAHTCCLLCTSALSNSACLVAGGAVRGVVGLNGRG